MRSRFPTEVPESAFFNMVHIIVFQQTIKKSRMKSNMTIREQLSASRLHRQWSLYKSLVLAMVLVLPCFFPDVIAHDQKYQYLDPELEMEIIRYLNQEDRLLNRQSVWPRKTGDLDGGDDVSGEWVLFTTMFMNATTGKGIMYVKLEQDGDVISGINGQLRHPFDPPSTIRAVSDRTLRGIIQGKWYPGNRTNMMVFERQAGTTDRGNAPAGTWAIFTAMIAADGRSAVGQIVNHGGYYGSFLMIKREALKDYLPLLEEEGRQAYEAKRLLGIEELEAGLSSEQLHFSVKFWWETDRNKDSYLSYGEFPHPDWHRANLNGDEFLSWAEELTDVALRRLAKEGKYMAGYGTSSTREWSSRSEWGCDRPGFDWLFPFIDRNRDRKICAREYTAFEDQVKTFLDGSVPLRNEWGQTGLEIYQGVPRGPLKTTYDSQFEWSRYKGSKMAWVYPFIDKDNDGKISSEEHQAFEDYKKKHTDWQDRARKQLRINSTNDN
jgi:hypothetical protein